MKTPLAIQFIALLALSAFIACKSDSAAPKQDNAVPSAITQSDSAGIKPQIWIYAVTVNDLLLRVQANKNSAATGKLQEGTFCIGRGAVSANREEVTLRDIQYNEPYYRVKGRSGVQTEGWAYGGGLLCVYAGTEKDAPSIDRLSAFSKLLSRLDPKKMSSGKQALGLVKAGFEDADTRLSNAVFFMLQHFLRRMEFEGEFYVQTEQFPWTEQDLDDIVNSRFDPKKYPLTKQIAEAGFRLVFAEGLVFPVVDYQIMLDNFESKCSPEVLSYIRQSLEEQLRPEFEDGTIILPLPLVADRAVFWENFNKKYPYFPLIDETKVSEQYTRQILVTGSDNTAIYDYETKTILPEYRDAWNYVLSKYPGTATYALVKSMRDLCEKEQWKYTKSVENKELEVLGLPAEE